MLLRMNKINERIQHQKQENFIENTSKKMFNDQSMRSKVNEMRNERINESINIYKESSKQSKITEIQNHSKQQRQQQQLKKLQSINLYHNQQEFKYFYNQITGKTKQIDFLKNTTKIKGNGHVQVIKLKRKEWEKQSKFTINARSIKICTDKQIWKQPMDIDIENDNNSRNHN